MCQQKLNQLNSRQGGYILIIVLSILVLISIMVTATYISTDTSLKAGSYEADRKYAVSIAEQASKIASEEVALLFSPYDPEHPNPDHHNDIFPPVTVYDQSKPGNHTIFEQLLEGGPALETIDGNNWPQYFNNDCSGNPKSGRYKTYPGLCAPAIIIDGRQYGDGLPAWSRENVFNASNPNGQCNQERSVIIRKDKLPNNSARNPCYVVEFLGINPNRILRYRITVIAWGRNANTNVKIESTYEIDQ